MHYSVFMEDYLEFEDWHDQENDEVNFNDSSAEERLITKIKSGDLYFRKQGFTDLFAFLQQNTNIDIFPSVFDAVKQFSTDEEPSLRCDFAESLITITKLAMSKTMDKWDSVEKFTVPCITKLLHDTNKQARLASHATVIFLLENTFMSKELFMDEIFVILEEIMVSYNPDELRTECFTLLVQISKLLNYCLEECLLGYCRDFIRTNDNLRKTCASFLLNIIEGSSEQHLVEWCEIFYKLSDDNSWFVKKFCIECAVSLSKRVSHEERWHKIANVYYNFMTDNKKWVITCAYQHFGAFIATFSDPAKAHCRISEEGKVVNIAAPALPVTECTATECTDTECNTKECTTNECTTKECTTKECTTEECTTEECTTEECTTTECTTKECTTKECTTKECTTKECTDTECTACSQSGHADHTFSSVCFWQQQIDDSLVPDAPTQSGTSPLTFSIKDIDLNQSKMTEFWAQVPTALPNYEQEIVPQKLLKCFSNLILEVSDTDLIRPCAFSMPAVLLTLGPSCWSFLRGPYKKLAQFMSWKVRLSLASSLHHVFHIFKHNPAAVDDLLWTYKELIKDVDEVKCGLMSHISEFYLALPIDRYAATFEDFDDLVHLDNAKNWRYRVSCMEQLRALIAGIEVESASDRATFVQMLKTHWLTVTFTFSEEDVWAVRSAAADTMIATLEKLIRTNKKMGGDPNEYDDVIKMIQDRFVLFSESGVWYMRQLFLHSVIKMVTSDVLPASTIDNLIMPKYLYLCCWDGVPNNRMVGGHGLAEICSHRYFEAVSGDTRKMIENVYHQLKVDKDRDVQDSVDDLRTVFLASSPE